MIIRENQTKNNNKCFIEKRSKNIKKTKKRRKLNESNVVKRLKLKLMNFSSSVLRNIYFFVDYDYDYFYFC